MKDFMSPEELQLTMRTTFNESLEMIKKDADESMKETMKQLETLETRSLVFRVLKCVGLGGSVACGINLLVSAASVGPSQPLPIKVQFHDCSWEVAFKMMRDLSAHRCDIFTEEHKRFTGFRDSCLNIGIVMLASAMMFVVSYFCEDTKSVAIAKIASGKYRGLHQSVKQYVAGRFLSDSIEDIEKQTKKFHALQSDITTFVTPVEFESNK